MLPSLLFAMVSAADLNGIWTGYTLNKNGDRLDTSLKLTQDAMGKIGGKVYGDYKSSPVVEGQVSGEEVTFFVQAQEQSGNQINDSRLKFTGKFVGADELELTRERVSESNAGNAGSSATKAVPAPKTVLKLRRLGSSAP